MTKALRIGVLRLLDSAPVIMAHKAGLFARYGIQSEVIVSPSWANIADGLSWGRLDAAVMFAPLAWMVTLGRRGHAIPLKPLLTLSQGGNAIILRGENSLPGPWPAGEVGKAAFERWRRQIGRRPKIAVVHIYSTHLLLLRRFLGMLGIDMAQEIEVQVMPPADILNALAEGTIDGGCVGAPWGAEACLRDITFCAGGSETVAPGHVEKQFVISENLLGDKAKLEGITAALQDATGMLGQPQYQRDIAERLAAPVDQQGLALPEAATVGTLCTDGFAQRPHYVCERHDSDDLLWCVEDMKALDWLDEGEAASIKAEWRLREA